ncbi:MAG: alkaline phosphatase family protein [Candidatus Sulfotelmatobacter sp.]
MFLRSVLIVCSSALGLIAAQPARKPKLIVGVVIDQFRYDYLTRFRADYHGGLDRLLSSGANFTNAHYLQTPTKTAVGHSIFLTGAMPAVSGIVSNEWYDRITKQQVTSVCDWTVQVVGAETPKQGSKCTDEDPASPRRLLVTTVGDELRNAHEESRVIGVSLKARAAILPSGHRANGAFWFDTRSGSFVSSTFYGNGLPAWAEAFNAKKLAAEYVNQSWPDFPKWSFRTAANSPEQYANIPGSPWGNELVEKFAEAAINGEKLGQHGVTDLLTVSFSSNDYVGHKVGPDAPEVRDMAMRVDAQLGKLFDLINRSVGLQNTIVVLTADHGVSALPAVNQERRLPGTYVSARAIDIVAKALNERFGKADWIQSGSNEGIYLNWKVLDEYKSNDGARVAVREIYTAAENAILSAPDLHAVRVYNREQLESGVAGDFIARSFMYGFFPRESPDLEIVYEPGVILGATAGTNHFSPYGYDSHVPVIFMGAGIRAGRYAQKIAPNDIAPTLASILDIEPPSGSSGTVLTEILEPGR